MITYVNTVLVGKGTDTILAENDLKHDSADTSNVGKYVILNAETGEFIKTIDPDVNSIRIGIVRPENGVAHLKDGSVEYYDVVKWSNVITKDSIKSFNTIAWTESTQDTIKIDFTKVNDAVLAEFAKGEKRIVIRLTYKDLPTRYRKFTESYEYVTAIGDDATKIAQNIATQINAQWKRARVTAVATEGVLTLTAMDYTDDNSNDSINWANRVRFNANVYYTDPTAPAFSSKNKYSISGLTIDKTPGSWCATDGKLVRDRESIAMGYEGILNRGNGTWPIIKPDMQADINAKYDGITLEFERAYRAADDTLRKAKETLEIYDITGTLTTLTAELAKFAGSASDVETEIN